MPSRYLVSSFSAQFCDISLAIFSITLITLVLLVFFFVLTLSLRVIPSGSVIVSIPYVDTGIGCRCHRLFAYFMPTKCRITQFNCGIEINIFLSSLVIIFVSLIFILSRSSSSLMWLIMIATSSFKRKFSLSHCNLTC